MTCFRVIKVLFTKHFDVGINRVKHTFHKTCHLLIVFSKLNDAGMFSISVPLNSVILRNGHSGLVW